MYQRIMGFCVLITGFLASSAFVNDASAKFKPFKCGEAVTQCGKSAKSLPTLIEGAKKACNQFKNCKSTCRVDKSECTRSMRRESKDLNKMLGKGSSQWVNRLCKHSKYTCKQQCEADYLSPACINSRAAVGEWLASAHTDKSGLGKCVKALKTCIPSPVTACTAGIYTIVAKNKSQIATAVQLVKKQCKNLRDCTKDCLVQPDKKKKRKCEKDCRKKLKSKGCKKARASMVKILTKQATDKERRASWFSAVKACSGF